MAYNNAKNKKNTRIFIITARTSQPKRLPHKKWEIRRIFKKLSFIIIFYNNVIVLRIDYLSDMQLSFNIKTVKKDT